MDRLKLWLLRPRAGSWSAWDLLGIGSWIGVVTALVLALTWATT